MSVTNSFSASLLENSARCFENFSTSFPEPDEVFVEDPSRRLHLTFRLASGGEEKVVDVPEHVEFISIGRSRQCVLSFPKYSIISVVHIHINRIESEGAIKYMIKDLDSRNGTSIDGMTLIGNEQYELKTGACVGMAHANGQPQLSFTFVIGNRTVRSRKRRSTLGGVEIIGEVIKSGNQVAPIIAPIATVTNGTGSADQPLTLINGAVIEEGKTKYPSKKKIRLLEEERKRLHAELDSSVHPGAQMPSRATALMNTLGSALRCSICLELLYNPLILSPCAHRFCAGCFSALLGATSAPPHRGAAVSSAVKCPNCRCDVISCMKDLQTREVIDGYLKFFPSEMQPEDHRNLLDEKDRFTKQGGNNFMIKQQKGRRSR